MSLICGGVWKTVYEKSEHTEDDLKELSGEPDQQFLDDKFQQFMVCSAGVKNVTRVER